MNNEKHLEVVVLPNIHSVTSISKEDYMASQAMLYRKTVIGSAITITTLFLALTKNDTIDENKISTIYSKYKEITDLKSVLEFILWVRDQQDESYHVYPDVNDQDKFCVTSMLNVDDFLTATVNKYLRYVLNTKLTIESAYLDFEELYGILEQQNLIGEAAIPLVNYVKDTLAVNFKNFDFIKDFIITNKTDIEQDCVMYMIPRLHIHSLSHLKGFHLKTLQDYLKQLTSGIRLMTKDHPEYPILEDLYNNSKEFKRHSRMLISYYTENDANIYTERKSLEVWRNLRGEFILVK